MKQQVKISKVKGNPDNPRIIKNDKFKKLVKSIQEFPEMLKLRPIVVDEDMMVLGGNMRLKASKDAGLKEVWIEVAEGLTEEQKKEFIVKDNVGFGEWEWDMLANEWDSVQLAEWGLDVWENLDDKEPEAGLIEDDEIPEVKESKVKRGDIWQLGEHRVMCGDSTSSDDVAKLMNGEKADMVFTDPPYGINEEGDRSKRGGLAKGNNLPSFKDDTIQYAIDAFNQPINKDIKIQVWFGANYYCHSLPQSANWLVWDKRVEENQRDYNSDCELAWIKSDKKSVRIFRHLWKGMLKDSERGEKRVHATQKPIALVDYCIKEYNSEATLLLDYFLGSGTTLMSCEKLNKKCYGMELDEKYCDVIIERWEQFTGQKAKKI